MLCLVLLLLVRCFFTLEAAELLLTPTDNKLKPEEHAGGSLIDEHLLTGQSGRRAPNLVDNLRRQLMRDNYDYLNKHSGEASKTELPASATTATNTVSTTTAAPTTATNVTSLSTTTETMSVRYSYGEEIDTVSRAHEPFLAQMQVASVTQRLYPGIEGRQERSRVLKEPATTPAPSPTQAPSPTPAPPPHQQPTPMHTSAEHNQQVSNRDLLYYVDDDRIKSGLNFRRRNNGQTLTETREEYEENRNFGSSSQDEDESLRRVTYDHHHRHSHHRHRHSKHMRRDAMYGSKRRVYKRVGRRHFRAVHKQNRQRFPVPAGQNHNRVNRKLDGRRHRLLNAQRNKGRNLRYRQHGRRRSKLNMLRRKLTTNKNIKNGRRNGVNADNMRGDDTARYEDSISGGLYEEIDGRRNWHEDTRAVNSALDEPQQYIDLNDRDTLSEENYNDQRLGELNSPQYDQFDKAPEVFKDGRRTISQTDDKLGTTETNPKVNVSTVKESNTTVKYKLLKVRSGRGSRRSGNGEAQILQKRGATGVALIPLNAPAFPQFRLPPSRRQYMYERSAGKAPLHELLPHHHKH